MGENRRGIFFIFWLYIVSDRFAFPLFFNDPFFRRFFDLPPRWRMPMDEFQYILDDDEVAAVASYIRNSWDNRAGLVTPEQVARQR